MFFSVKVLSALIHDDSGHFNNVSKGNKSQTRPFTNVFSLQDGVVQKTSFTTCGDFLLRNVLSDTNGVY